MNIESLFKRRMYLIVLVFKVVFSVCESFVKLNGCQSGFIEFFTEFVLSKRITENFSLRSFSFATLNNGYLLVPSVQIYLPQVTRQFCN